MDKDFDGGIAGVSIFVCIVVILLCFAVFHGERKNEEHEIERLIRTNEIIVVNGKEYSTDSIVDIEVKFINYSDDVVTFTLEDGSVLKTSVHGFNIEKEKN